MKYSRIKRDIVLICSMLMTCFVWTSSLLAQEQTPERKWHFLAEPYVMFPYMSGETGLGNALLVPVDADPGDIFSNLKMAAMLYFEARTDKWAITTDWVYMKLDNELTPGTLINSGTVGVKQSIWEVAGLYRILPFWEVGIGGRLNYLQTSIDARRNIFPSGTEEVSGIHDDTWFDPVIITRLSTDIKDKWPVQFRADVGGFGLGSDLTWQLQAYAGYRFGKLFQLSAGFRVISIDYRTDVDYTDFVFNMKEFGPVIRFGFNF